MDCGRARGFTLIEILVTLVIVAAMAGLLVFSMRDNPGRALKREASGLATLINTAVDEAVMQSQEFGLVVNDSGYRFVAFDPHKKKWMPLQRAPLGEHRFEAGYSVQFALDGKQIDDAMQARIETFIARGSVDTEADMSDGDLKPVLLMLSSGELTAFSLTLRYKDAAYTLSSDGFNPVTIATAEVES